MSIYYITLIFCDKYSISNPNKEKYYTYYYNNTDNNNFNAVRVWAYYPVSRTRNDTLHRIESQLLWKS